MGRKKTKTKAQEVAERAKRQKLIRDAFNLKTKGGMSYYEVGEALGVSEATAYRLVLEALETTQKITEEEVNSWRDIEATRLENLIRTLAEKANNPNHKEHIRAVEETRKLSESLRKLRGVDAPKHVDVTSGGEPLCGIVGVPLEDI